MAYATIEDVETRLGYTLSTGIAQAVSAYLEDFSFWLDALIADAGYEAPSEAALNKVVALHGAGQATLIDQGQTYGYGVVSSSKTVGDTNEYLSFAAGSGSGRDVISSGFYLTAADKLILGFSRHGGQIGSWTMTRSFGL